MRFILAFLGLCSVMMLALWLYPRGPYLTIVSNPFTSPATIVAIAKDSNSQLIDLGPFGWSANLYNSHSNAIERLFSSGAILVLRNYAPTTCLQEVQP